MVWSGSVVRSGVAVLAIGLVVPSVWAAAPVAGDEAATGSMFRMSNALVSPDASFRYETSGVSSSAEDAVADERANLSGDGLVGSSAQPPTGHRRSYGRSRYQDRLHNSDGSTKIAFVGGAGLNVPVANTGKFYTPSYTITAGAGYNFNKMFGVLAEFHYDHLGLTGGSIANEYNSLITNYGATPDDLAGIDANGHFIALTLNPVVTFSNDRSKFGAYATAGGGYYRKTTNFTLPQLGEACNGYFCSEYESNQTFDSATANGYGFNGGVGLTYKISSFSSERLFLEARYHWMKIGTDANNTDVFQYNRRNSEYIPITAGIRF